MFGRQRFGALGCFDHDLARCCDCRIAHQRGHFVFLQQMRHASVQLLSNAARAGHNSIQIIINILRQQAKFFGALHQMINFRRAQHRFGWNTAPVEADATHMLAFHNNGFQSQLRCTNSSHVATGPRTNNDHIICIVSHHRTPFYN